MRTSRTLLGLALALALSVIAPTSSVVGPAASQAQEAAVATVAPHRPRTTRRARTPRRPNSASIGFAFRGRLRRAVHLDESALIRHAGEYRAGGNFYGTTELVGLLERAAAQVSRRLPGARLSVGELSRQSGGPIPGHRSHQNGRDVDIAFYMLDGAQHPYDPYAFAAFDRLGHGITPNESLTFDDARNWELVARLVADADARVQYIFVADTLKQRLLRTARRRRAPSRVITRAEAVMVQPAHGHPHRNHFHVRIYCPPGDRPACEDREPYHAWYPGTPPARASAAEDAAAASD
ncbi:MAG: penicillin-insensitive murein endopeptidase [Deltaproteobacteria bacterium]|nr:penicillin-insensitive murein endopeptidase [Deltaproteobacteria bacterium]